LRADGPKCPAAMASATALVCAEASGDSMGAQFLLDDVGRVR
jgi:hypothetical protein